MSLPKRGEGRESGRRAEKSSRKGLALGFELKTKRFEQKGGKNEDVCSCRFQKDASTGLEKGEQI